MGSKLEDDTHIVEKKNAKKNGTSFVTGDAAMVPKWAQKTVTLPPQKRGCHLITPLILKDIEADLAYFKCGLAHLFLQHTSASLTINENYDNDVLDDVETWLNGTVPEGGELHGSIHWKDRMICQHTSSLPCLVVRSQAFEKASIGRNAPQWRWRWGCSKRVLLHFAEIPEKLMDWLPITDGRLNLGTWQGIWLCEHRDHGSARKVVVTLTGA